MGSRRGLIIILFLILGLCQLACLLVPLPCTQGPKQSPPDRACHDTIPQLLPVRRDAFALSSTP